MVCPGGGHLKRESSEVLTSNIGHIGFCYSRVFGQWLGRFRPALIADQHLEQVGQVGHRLHPTLGYQLRLMKVVSSHNDGVGIDDIDQRKNTGYRPKRAVETQLGERPHALDHVRLQLPRRDKNRQSDGQVQAGTARWNAGRRKVDGDSGQRPLGLAAEQGCPDPVAGLATRCVGPSNNAE